MFKIRITDKTGYNSFMSSDQGDFEFFCRNEAVECVEFFKVAGFNYEIVEV